MGIRLVSSDQRTGVNNNEHRYTGHLRDPETGNEYAGARYYNGARTRWMSVDPVLGNTANPQDLNRYAYVLNDPVNFWDPDGRRPVLKRQKRGSGWEPPPGWEEIEFGPKVNNAPPGGWGTSQPIQESGPQDSSAGAALSSHDAFNDLMKAKLMDFLRGSNCSRHIPGQPKYTMDEITFFDLSSGVMRNMLATNVAPRLRFKRGTTLGSYMDATHGAVATILMGRNLDGISVQSPNVLISDYFSNEEYMSTNGLTQSGVLFHEYYHLATGKDDLGLAEDLKLGSFANTKQGARDASAAVQRYIDAGCPQSEN